MKKLSFLPLICLQLATQFACASLPHNDIQQRLESQGLVGLLHAAQSEQAAFVMSFVPDPANFFARYYFSLLPASVAIKEQFAKLHRNDKIRVYGTLKLQRMTKQGHISVNKIEVIENFRPLEVATCKEPVAPQASVADLIEAKDRSKALVHAVPGDGVLVLEVGNKVVPTYVKQPELIKDLGRGDLVDAQIVVRGNPEMPVHAQLATQREGKDPVLKVLERFADRNDKPAEITGRLVLFPKSPLINRDVWAVEEKLPDGLARYYTLVNMSDTGFTPEMENVSKKLREIWDGQNDCILQERNKLMRPSLAITVKGTVMVTSIDQANAQINLRAENIQKADVVF